MSTTGKKTADFLDRLRDASRAVQSNQEALQDALAKDQWWTPTPGLTDVASRAARFTAARQEFAGMLEAARVLQIPRRHLEVACGDDTDAFWSLFDAYREGAL